MTIGAALTEETAQEVKAVLREYKGHVVSQSMFVEIEQRLSVLINRLCRLDLGPGEYIQPRVTRTSENDLRVSWELHER